MQLHVHVDEIDRYTTLYTSLGPTNLNLTEAALSSLQPLNLAEKLTCILRIYNRMYTDPYMYT